MYVSTPSSWYKKPAGNNCTMIQNKKQKHCAALPNTISARGCSTVASTPPMPPCCAAQEPCRSPVAALGLAL